MHSKPPFYSQETDYSCVPACLRMVLAAYGREFTEVELRARCECDDGTKPSNAEQAVLQLGFSKSKLCNPELGELQAVLERGVFPIVFVKMGMFSNKHAIVVIEISNDKVTFLDPLMRREEDGTRQLALAEFERMWAAKLNETLLWNKQTLDRRAQFYKNPANADITYSSGMNLSRLCS